MLRYTDTIEQEAADCFVIRRRYSDGMVIILGCYSARRDAAAELRLIREAA